jgi:hypothetical protein
VRTARDDNAATSLCDRRRFIHVPENYDETHLFLSVVADKFGSGGKAYFAVSSALSIGEVQTTVGSLTHDVIVEPSLEKTAQAVAYFLSAVELRGITGLSK